MRSASPARPDAPGTATAPGDDEGTDDGTDLPDGPSAVAPHRLVSIAFVVAVAAGVVLRFVTTSALWLDEALTVNIARLPLDEMFDALRRDGAPPLYYVLLHGWTAVFGAGDLAARSLSGVFAVASLPLAWVAGRQVGGRRVGHAAVILLATSPFAIRYATEARMYSLVIALVLAGYVGVRLGLARPAWPVLAGVAVVAGLLALTHYWSFYLLAPVAVLLTIRWRQRHDPAAARLVLAIGAGGALFVPWIPGFLFQLRHTGTPWGRPAGPIDVAITTATDFAGGRPPEARTLAAVLALLVVVALTARPSGRLRLEVDLRTRPGVRVEVAVAAATVLLAVAANRATATAFASRYTAVLFPLVILAAAWGIRQFGDRRVAAGVLAAAAVLGIAGGLRNVAHDRTQAPDVAALINRQGRPGDVVAYCPDQLGPAVDRLLDGGFRQMTFPSGSSPTLVDWSDYEERHRAADPVDFANEVLAVADRRPGADVWLVWMPGYRTLGQKCERLSIALGAARPEAKIVLLHDRTRPEPHNVTRLRAP